MAEHYALDHGKTSPTSGRRDFPAIGPCPVCDGIGYVALDSVRCRCVECDGVGRVREPVDANARRLMFEIIGVIGPKRGRTAAI